MKKIIWGALAVVAAAIVVAVVLNLPTRETAAPPGAQSAHREVAKGPTSPPLAVKVGAILPLTGWSAEFGTHEKNAATVAVEALRQRYADCRFDLVIEDTGSDTKGAVAAFNKMTAGSPPQMVLVESSGASLALADLFDKVQLLMLSISANPDVTGKSGFIFRNFPTAEQETVAILSYVRTRLKAPGVGILHINNDYGLGFVAAFQHQLKQQGTDLAFVEPYASDAKDFKSVVTKLVDKDPGAVYIVGYGSAMGTLIKEIRQSGYRGQVLACSSVIYDDVMAVAPDAMDGTVFADVAYAANEDRGEGGSFVAGYRRLAGKAPSPLAAMVYDGVMMMGGALAENAADPRRAREALLQKGRYEGINGRIGVPPSRDLTYQLTIKRVEGGKGVPVP